MPATQRGSVRSASRSYATEFTVLLVGCLVVSFAIAYQAATHRSQSVADQLISGIGLAVGGGILGAAINTLIVRRYEHDVLAEISTLLADSLQARFTSREEELGIYRRTWHHYYLTERDQELTWWYEQCSFGQNPAVGSAVQRTALRDTFGNSHAYVTEMGVRGQRLILLESREDGSEAAGVEVYPMPRGFRPTHAGVAFLETWDGTHLLGKAILSETPLVDALPEGPVPAVHAATLHQSWKKLFERNIRVALGAAEADPTVAAP